jgi:hypothetical protein
MLGEICHGDIGMTGERLHLRRPNARIAEKTGKEENLQNRHRTNILEGVAATIE